MVGRIATGEIEEMPSAVPNRAKGGKAGGKARADGAPPATSLSSWPSRHDGPAFFANLFPVKRPYAMFQLGFRTA
jgi:hypothetical protein